MACLILVISSCLLRRIIFNSSAGTKSGCNGPIILMSALTCSWSAFTLYKSHAAASNLNSRVFRWNNCSKPISTTPSSLPRSSDLRFAENAAVCSSWTSVWSWTETMSGCSAITCAKAERKGCLNSERTWRTLPGRAAVRMWNGTSNGRFPTDISCW